MGGFNETSRSRSAVLGDALICLLFALLLRFATFGDPNLHMDEAFYFYVGLEMHQGAVPYVDIWDRKPLGLFILYWMFAGISSSVLAYQIPAWLFASYTAWVISRIVALFGSRLAGLLAAGAYLTLLLPLNGHGGQSPVFYNALIASAVWLVLLADGRLKQGEVPKGVWGAMMLAGLAITIKQTTLFEAVFLGLWVVWRLWRSGMPSPRLSAYTAGLAAIGAAPWLVIAGWYFLAGYWDRYWFAMVTANLARPIVSEAPVWNLPILLHALGLLLAAVVGSVIVSRGERRFAAFGPFFGGWLFAATIGFLSVPLYLDHYALPLLLPLCTVAAAYLGRFPVGNVLGITIICSAIVLTNPFDISGHAESKRMFSVMSSIVDRTPRDGGLYIYDGPMFMYAHPKTRRLTPYMFPWHLVTISESGTSPVRQESEFKRILRKRPEYIITTTDWRPPAYPDQLIDFRAYIRENCHLLYRGKQYLKRGPYIDVYLYGRCNEAR